MLSRPKFMSPSINTQNCVIDASTENVIFSCIVDGNESIEKWQIKIYRLKDNVLVYDSGEIDISGDPFYPIDQKNKNVVFSKNIKNFETQTDKKDAFKNGYFEYYWTIQFWGSSVNTTTTSTEEVFYANKEPEVNIKYLIGDSYNDLNANTTIYSKGCSFKATYKQDNNVQLKKYGWRLTDATANHIISDTISKNNIYGTSDNIVFYYDGFLSGGQYSIELFIENQNGYSLTTQPTNFTVDYDDNNMSVDYCFEAQVLENEPAVMLGWNGNSAGQNSSETGVSGYEIRRKTSSNLYTDYVATVQVGYSTRIIDYSIANKTKYEYFLYPLSEKSNTIVSLSPSKSTTIMQNWGYWTLLVVDESAEENVFYLNKIFKFELNISTDDMNNNATISVAQNFTRYPTIQYSTSNYWSGGLTSLCGYIAVNDIEYIQTPNMIKELKELTSDTRRKFLKDVDGNVWEIQITSPITISNNDDTLENIKSVRVSWAEVGEASNISIINNPEKLTESWVLTETGIASPYIDYVWKNDEIWNGDYMWTGRDDILETEITNLGRDIRM